MKKTVLTFGLISGLIISVLMGGSLLLAGKIGAGHSMALGYTNMVASFLLIYFGIRSYRDNTLAGRISFARAFACGILITLIPPEVRPGAASDGVEVVHLHHLLPALVHEGEPGVEVELPRRRSVEHAAQRALAEILERERCAPGVGGQSLGGGAQP